MSEQPRSSVGVIGAHGIDEDPLFRQLLHDGGLPVDRVEFNSDGGFWEYTITAGDEALATFRPDLRSGWCHGRPVWLPDSDRIVFPVLHHESYRRNATWRPQLVEEIRFLKHIAVMRRHGDNWVAVTPETCVICRGPLHLIDPNNVAYCESHAPSPQ